MICTVILKVDAAFVIKTLLNLAPINAMLLANLFKDLLRYTQVHHGLQGGNCLISKVYIQIMGLFEGLPLMAL